MTLRWNLDVADFQLKDHELPIGADIFGSQLVLNARTGAVDFYDALGEQRIDEVAASFTALITRLEVDPAL